MTTTDTATSSSATPGVVAAAEVNAPSPTPIIIQPQPNTDPITNPNPPIPIQPPLSFSTPPPHRMPHKKPHKKNNHPNKPSPSSQSAPAASPSWKVHNPNPTAAPNFRSVPDQMRPDPATEEQLEEMLLRCLDYYYGEALTKLSMMGYDDKAVLDAVLRSGHCYGGSDVVTNIMHNTIGYLSGGYGGEDVGDGGCDEFMFTELDQLKEYCLAGLICLLQQARPELSRGEAMWCLLVCELNLAQAGAVEIPMAPSSVGSGVGAGGGVGAVPLMCGYHCGCCESKGDGLAMSNDVRSGEGGQLLKEMEFADRFNLTPAMKALLRRNVAMFAAGFRSKMKPEQMRDSIRRSIPSHGSDKGSLGGKSAADLVDGFSNQNNHDLIGDVMNKFQNLGLNLSSDTGPVSEEQKDQVVATLTNQLKDLERQVQERKEWAQQRAMQAARRVSNDLNELKLLRMEMEDTQRVKKGKQALEETTMKRLSEMENALRKASGQVDRANAAVRRLETENAEIRAEMEAAKLSASESGSSSFEAAKRDKKAQKKLLAAEKQRAKLLEEIAEEKRKINEARQELANTKRAATEAEAEWRKLVIDRTAAVALVEEQRRLKEAAEASSKRALEVLRLQAEIDLQRYKDDHRRLEQELSRLKLAAQNPSKALPNSKSDGVRQHGGETVVRPLNDSEERQASVDGDRRCLLCHKDEVSVVFLPCAHQVVCARCSEGYGKKGKAPCPCCRVPIEERIRVFGASC
ncbi:hypothetical protein MLD38_010641 [Melastoma candidum]|uniref:Uncharacterized protein n=1 Tax=Melastoma candidum TaxID=119954 RepID=A0ACB9R0I2_9MYRT|nr:hypothetical protein MLD38_010641 [Melastoma candidum]